MPDVSDPNAVPVQVIAPYIKRWLEKYALDHPHQRQGREGNCGYITYSPGDHGRLDVLAHNVGGGIAGRTLGQYMRSNLEFNIPFDVADRIICATEGPMAWQTNDDLIPYYGPFKVRPKELEEGRELPEGFDLKSVPRAYLLDWENARQRLEAAA